MRCLYCGKELALLKRLRGGGDFCSDAHKQSYQEEYNRLALSRLLQAQKKGQQPRNSPAQNVAPPPNAAVALEELAREDDELASEEGELAPEDAFSAVDAGEGASALAPEEAIDSVAALQSPTGAVGHARTTPSGEPAEAAGFIFEPPAGVALADETPYQEPWLELSPGPAMSEWHTRNGAFGLSSADLLALDVRAKGSSIEAHAFPAGHFTADVSPQAFASSQPDPPRSSAARAKKIADANRFPIGSIIVVDIAPNTVASDADESLVQGIGFESAVLFEDSRLLELSPAAIDFPAEDSDVGVPLDVAPSETQAELPAKSVETPAQAIEAVAEEEPKPKFSTELFEIPIKTFPPAKAALIGGEAFPSNIAPLLPHLKFLPLRPKIALALGYVPPSQASAVAETQPAPPAPTAVSTQAPPKAATTGKPAARLTQPKQPSQPAKPMQAAAAKALAPKAPPADKGDVPTPAPAAVQAKPDNVPQFDIAQPTDGSWLGSLKVKLGIAIVLLLMACVYFLGWGRSKPGKPASSNPAVSNDGSGPSIMMGEGGWVENWGGDPSGLHNGRQITIYRPSLKLSDYRLEFQGSIDTKSLGWVFRASDPDNYYAMKLMTVSTGLSPKLALFKYLVVNGKQTQVGRVPIDLAVGQETVFDIRVDVRGPQFTTYIQGQQVDSWTDDQLKTGGAGFLNERDERGTVKSVSIRYLSGATQ